MNLMDLMDDIYKKNDSCTGYQNSFSFDEESEFLNEIRPINKKLLGRKNKNSEEVGKHTKHSEDNKIRKIKRIFRDDLLEFINNKIATLKINILDINFDHEQYKGKKIEIKKTTPEQINDTSVDGNKDLFHKTIKDFFSVQISPIYRMYPPNFNALLIEKIYQIDNEGKITSILDKTFLECLKYYRKEKFTKKKNNYECLNGLETKFEKSKDKLMESNDKQYTDDVIRLIQEYDIIYFNKTARK